MARRMPARTRTRENRPGWNKDRERNDSERKSQLQEGLHSIDFRDAALLRKYVTQHGKIMPSRITGTTAKQQRALARSIRRSRVVGIMP